MPREDLYVNEEGYLVSQRLEAEYERLGHKDFQSRYGEIADRLQSWSESCCEHEDMHICDEWVCNLSGWSKMKWLFQALGERTPILAGMLPDANGGMFPARLADAALKELATLETKLDQLLPGTYTDLTRCSDGVVCWRRYNDEKYDGRHYDVRLTNDRFYYWKNGRPDEEPHKNADFASSHFKATLIEGKIDRFHNMQRKGTVLLEDLEKESPSCEMSWVCLCRVDSMFREDPVEYRVNRGSDLEWGRWKIGIIRRLLEASRETGNPIQWC